MSVFDSKSFKAAKVGAEVASAIYLTPAWAFVRGAMLGYRADQKRIERSKNSYAGPEGFMTVATGAGACVLSMAALNAFTDDGSELLAPYQESAWTEIHSNHYTSSTEIELGEGIVARFDESVELIRPDDHLSVYGRLTSDEVPEINYSASWNLRVGATLERRGPSVITINGLEKMVDHPTKTYDLNCYASIPGESIDQIPTSGEFVVSNLRNEESEAAEQLCSQVYEKAVQAYTEETQ